MQQVGLYDALVQPVVDNAGVISASTALWFGLQGVLDYGVPALAPAWHARVVAASTKEDWASIRTRIIGSIFSLYASTLAAYVLLFDAPVPTAFYAKHDTVHTWLVGVTVGFFIWDVVLCIREAWGAAYLAHGLAVLAVYTAGLYPFLPYMACICILYEASTPLLHLRKLMLTFGYAKSHPGAFQAATMAFGLVFFVARIVVGLWKSAQWAADMLTLLNTGEYHSFPVLCMFLTACALLSGLNIWWFFEMTNVMLKGNKAMKALDEKQK